MGAVRIENVLHEVLEHFDLTFERGEKEQAQITNQSDKEKQIRQVRVSIYG